MTYYEQLQSHMRKAMKEHPHSVIAMDAETFDVLASGRNADKVAELMAGRLKRGHRPAIFQRPKKSETWIL